MPHGRPGTLESFLQGQAGPGAGGTPCPPPHRCVPQCRSQGFTPGKPPARAHTLPEAVWSRSLRRSRHSGCAFPAQTGSRAKTGVSAEGNSRRLTQSSESRGATPGDSLEGEGLGSRGLPGAVTPGALRDLPQPSGPALRTCLQLTRWVLAPGRRRSSCLQDRILSLSPARPRPRLVPSPVGVWGAQAQSSSGRRPGWAWCFAHFPAG